MAGRFATGTLQRADLQVEKVRAMTILGIETSCDETAAALVVDGRTVLSNVCATSQPLHQKTGGIVPEVAAREQIKCILPVVAEALGDYQPSDVDALAVTVTPGLIGSLLVGVAAARTLAWLWEKPLVPVDHLMAHLYSAWLEREPEFPLVALVVSGGHTELYLMSGHDQLRRLGGTRDDAAGEAFDKVARILGLGYPGGPEIARLAGEVSSTKDQVPKIKLPRPLINSDDLDFSFSGLKTAVVREVKMAGGMTDGLRSQIATEFQEAATDVLVAKTLKAARQFGVKSTIIGGGVAVNQRLREKFQKSAGKLEVLFPRPRYCTDNAAMVAAAAFWRYHPVAWEEVRAFMLVR